jgi:hypothetical protein
VYAVFARQKASQCANAIGQTGDDHRAVRNAFISRYGDLSVDSWRSLDPQFHRNQFENFPEDFSAAALCSCGRAHQHPISGALVQLPQPHNDQLRTHAKAGAIVDLTERGKSSGYKDP